MDFFNARPFQIIVIGVFGVLALVGLYLFATFNGFMGGKQPIGPVVIWGTVSPDAMGSMLQELRNADKRYGEVTYKAKPEATFETELLEALASGSGPDLVLITQEDLLSQQSKIDVLPFSSGSELTERTYVENFLPITEFFMVSGGTYALPLAVDPLVLYYNRTQLATNGVAEAPRTWEAVAGLATQFTQRSLDGGIEKSLIGFGEYENVTNARAIVSLFLLQAGSTLSEYTSSGYRSTINSGRGASGVTPTTAAMNFYTQFSDPAKTLYSWNRSMPESRAAFLAGDVALYVGYASELPELKEANPNLDFDMARIPQPGVSSTRITYGKAYGLAVPKGAKNKSGAFLTAVELTLGDYPAQLARDLSMAPARRSLLKAEQDDRYGELFYPEALIARGWLSPSPRETDSIFGTMIGNITTGRMDAQAAITTADQSLNAAF